jgi:hypothetical protein
MRMPETMRTTAMAAVAAAFALSVGACLAGSARAQTSPTPHGWPRVAVSDGDTITIYQPQLTSWDYVTLITSAAVAVKPAGARQETSGTIHTRATTRVDRSARTVYFESMEITGGEFPSAGSQADAYLARIRALMPRKLGSMSLDRLEASLAELEARRTGQSQPLRNDPPVIIFTSEAAVLVPIDGPPIYQTVPKTKVERAVNTRALLLRDSDRKLYLHLFDGYVTASALGGPWAAARAVPKDVAKAETQAVETKQVDLLAGHQDPDTQQYPSLKTTPIPALYLTTLPTELIVTSGQPQWAPVDSTRLLYVTNTNAHVFRSTADQKIYVLISGRWFRSPSLDGPWEFVPAESLPADFARIPDDSPTENAKASVPGTEQAEEAAIANTIPQNETVDRTTAMDPAPVYDGDPRLEPIEGTPLHYVMNCATPVIEVDDKTWLACENGVWFAATSPDGPWVVATSVPAIIYSIPPSSPMYYVTFVRVVRYDPSTVWVATTPGYYGTVVGPDGLVVFGTGYTYAAYVGPSVVVSYPITYGYGCDPCWTPWSGWSFGFAVGWPMAADYHFWCACPPAPFWGPYWAPCYHAHYNAYGGITAWGPYGWAGTSGFVYWHHGRWPGEGHGAAAHDPWTGHRWASRYGRAYNSITGTRVAGRPGGVQNVFTGGTAFAGRGAASGSKPGNAPTGVSVAPGHSRTAQPAPVGHPTGYTPGTVNATHGSGIKAPNGGAIDVQTHVIAGRNGNYYRPDGVGGWQEMKKPMAQNIGGQAPPVQRQTPGSPPAGSWQPYKGAQTNALNRELNSRELGAQRQSSFQANQPQFAGSSGGPKPQPKPQPQPQPKPQKPH